MHLNTCTIHREGFYFAGYQMFVLKTFKNPVQHSVFTPPAHAQINGVPVAEFLWQTSPFAAIFQNVQYGIDNFKVVMSNIPALPREAVRNPFILFFRYLHVTSMTLGKLFCN